MGHGEGHADRRAEGSQRDVYSTIVTSLVGIAARMHFHDFGCDGRLSTGGVERERADSMSFSLICLKFGADLGRVPISGTGSTSTALGKLIPASTFDHWFVFHVLVFCHSSSPKKYVSPPTAVCTTRR